MKPSLKKLPGFVRSPPGMEWTLWRRLPAILLWGTVLPLFFAWVRRWPAWMSAISGDERALLIGDYMMIGIVLLHWTLVLTLALGCAIVMLMKGPAYVADAYPLEDSDSPRPSAPDASEAEHSPPMTDSFRG